MPHTIRSAIGRCLRSPMIHSLAEIASVGPIWKISPKFPSSVKSSLMIRCVTHVSFPFPQFLIRLPYIDILSARNRCRHCRSAGAYFEWPHLDLRVGRRSDFYLCSYPEHSKCVCHHQSVHDAQMETSGICRASRSQCYQAVGHRSSSSLLV